MSKIPAVPNSPEFLRIWSLPRREISWFGQDRVPPQIPDYRTDRGKQILERVRGMPPAPAEVRYWQAVAANELYWNFVQWRLGLFAAFPVGIGKTWITFIAALICGARRPLLIVPAMAVEKTRIEFAELARDWVQPQPMPLIETYSALTQARNVKMLDTIRPDLLILDESNKARKLDKGSVAIRIDRYCTEHRPVVVALTGTLGRKTYADYAHIMKWCLWERSPLPLHSSALWQWCQALDDDDLVGLGRWRPGVLLSFAKPLTSAQEQELENDPWLSDGGVNRAREGVLDRMRQTPGVLIVDESTCDQPLEIDFIQAPHDAVIEKAFYDFRKTSETLDGYRLLDNLSKFSYLDELGQGFYSRWDPRAPADWLAARRDWADFVTEQIEATRYTLFPLDTEGAVELAHPQNAALLAWQAIQAREPVFVPNPVATWVSASVVYTAAQWIQHWEAQGEKVMVWVRSKPMAQALMSVCDVPYYGSKGLRHDQLFRPQRESIENVARNPDGSPKTSALLSFPANHIVRNLQRYNRSLIIGWEGAADMVEQFLGRDHRSGQTRTCYTTVLLTSGETISSFSKTLGEARGVAKRNGHTQKILQANIGRWPAGEGSRWLNKADEELDRS